MAAEKTVTTLDEAIRLVLGILAEHPERDALAAHEAACGGKPRRFPVLYLGHLGAQSHLYHP